MFLPPPSPVLANIHSILAYDVRCTSYRGCRPTHQIPAQNWASVRRSPLLVKCRSNIYDAGPTLIHHWVCCILCADMWYSPNAVSLLIHSLRRWPGIETALGDCTVFFDCCIMRVTISIPAPETPENTIHWPNANVMLGHRLRRWANIIPTKTLQALNHKYNHEYFFLITC